MKRLFSICILATAIFILPAYDKNDIILKDIEITIIKAENTLRYDLSLRNTGNEDINSEYDYPGHHLTGFEVVVRPNEKLESLMQMEEQTEFKKMRFRGSGGTGLLKIGKDANFHIEYQIKTTSDLNDVKKNAFDSTLILLDGHKIVKEFPLKKFLK